MSSARSSRILLAAALACGALLAGPAQASAACAGEDLRPTSGNLGQIASATLCLHNEQRAAHGLPPLRTSGLLAGAADGHSRDMVSGGYFSHDSADGRKLTDRVRATGYLTGARAWSIGENIAWGSGSFSTARDTMTRWMNSTGHRSNILDPDFRELGVGVVLGAPRAVSGSAATYTVDFGVRSPELALTPTPPSSNPPSVTPPGARPAPPKPKSRRWLRSCLRRAGRSRSRRTRCYKLAGRRPPVRSLQVRF